jgi:hypothetical protein
MMSRGRMMVVRPPRGHRATDDVRPTPCVWIIHGVHLLPRRLLNQASGAAAGPSSVRRTARPSRSLNIAGAAFTIASSCRGRRPVVTYLSAGHLTKATAGERRRRYPHAPIRPSRPVGRVWRGFPAAPGPIAGVDYRRVTRPTPLTRVRRWRPRRRARSHYQFRGEGRPS